MFIKLLPYIAALGLLVAAYSIGHIKGNASCEVKNAKSQTIAIIKEDQIHAKVEKKVMSLSDRKLDAALGKWMRD